MEIYSDNKIKVEAKKGVILIAFFCFLPFQIMNVYVSEYYFTKYFCWFMLLISCIPPLLTFTKFGSDLIKERLEFIFILFLFLIFNFSMLIVGPIISHSNKLFDTNFYMFTILVLTNITGFIVGIFLVAGISF